MIRDPPQHLIWPLESKAQACHRPHEIAVAVRPVPSETAGRKSPIWFSSLPGEKKSLSPRPNWPLPLYPAVTSFKISNHRSGLQKGCGSRRTIHRREQSRSGARPRPCLHKRTSAGRPSLHELRRSCLKPSHSIRPFELAHLYDTFQKPRYCLP